MSLRFLIGLAAVSGAAGCGGDVLGAGSIGDPDSGGDETTTTDAGVDAADAADSADAYTCTNLQCQQVTCNSGSTTVSGTVFAPNGTLPLYNVIVYVPNKDLDPITPGVTCDHCGVLSSGAPLTVGLTDAKGQFQLTNVPVGTNIPLVMQVGKWRRKITIPQVNACVDNPVGKKTAGIEDLTRLPKNQKEGDMPMIAVTTGGCDQFACLLPKLGIDSIEYAPGPTSSSVLPKTAISFYNGGAGTGPTGTTSATPFWNDIKQLSNFDIAIFSCECYEATPQTKDQTSWDAVLAYLQAGGRVFTTDFQYTWYKNSKDTNLNAPPWSWPGMAPFQGSPFTIDQSFPKGKAFADWLYNASSIAPYSTTTTQPPVKGQFPSAVPFGNIKAVDPKYGTSWVAGSDSQPKFVTMNEPSSKMPIDQCGKAVHADQHINASESVSTTFPSGCTSNVKESELAAAFFFFDLASCIQSDTAPVVVPVIK